jgi:hypothetical protein
MAGGQAVARHQRAEAAEVQAEVIVRAEDIPEFIFRGAVVAVNGREETVKEFSLLTPVTNTRGRGKPEPCLYIEFRNGLCMEYDAGKIREIPGRVPDFIHEGARIFCKDPPSKKPTEDRFRTAGNGEWEVVRFNVGKDDDGKQRLRLLLKRPWVPGDAILSRHFNPRTMTPIPGGQGTAVPPVPIYELQNDISVKKPLVFRPKA